LKKQQETVAGHPPGARRATAKDHLPASWQQSIIEVWFVRRVPQYVRVTSA
jgi:hypothetical protein